MHLHLCLEHRFELILTVGVLAGTYGSAGVCASRLDNRIISNLHIDYIRCDVCKMGFSEF